MFKFLLLLRHDTRELLIWWISLNKVCFFVLCLISYKRPLKINERCCNTKQEKMQWPQSRPIFHFAVLKRVIWILSALSQLLWWINIMEVNWIEFELKLCGLILCLLLHRLISAAPFWVSTANHLPFSSISSYS